MICCQTDTTVESKERLGTCMVDARHVVGQRKEKRTKRQKVDELPDQLYRR